MRHFDESNFTNFRLFLQRVEEIFIHDYLKQAEQQAEQDARDFADGLDEEYREAVIADESQGRFAESKEEVYWRSVQLHAFLARPILRWLETFLPPTFPRLRTFRNKNDQSFFPQIGDIQDCGIKEVITLASGFMQLLATTDEKVGTLFLRSLLLYEAFRGMIHADDLEKLFDVQMPKQIEVQWEKIWEHYSTLASLQAGRLTQTVTNTNLLQPPIHSKDFQLLAEQIQSLATKMDETVEAVRFDHTVIMARQAEMEKGLRKLLEEAKQAPLDLYDSCQKEVQNILGGIFKKLEPSARNFLVTAEFGYRQYPAEADFSGVVLGFAKAFEVQLKKAIEPFKGKLQNCLDAESSQERKTKVDRLPFGPLLRLFKNNQSSLQPEFQKYGLSLEQIIKKTELVNRESGAKHTKEITKDAATTFYGLFLGTDPVLQILFPE